MSKLRRSMMYVPGNSPAMLVDSSIYGADSVMFDLEDAVMLREKDAARHMVYQALKTYKTKSTEWVVRINGLDTAFGIKDIETVVRAGVDVIRLPKTETAQDVIDVERIVEAVEKEVGLKVGSVKLMAALEGPLGVINAFEIAKASKRMIGLAIGAEDFVTSMKTTRSKDGIELQTARSQLVMAARAAGIAALDTVFSDVEDMDGFQKEVELIKQMGFDGKSVINPRQIDVVHNIFRPGDKEIKNALAVMAAFEEAKERGSGVISLNGKMIDKPIVERALRILELSGHMEGNQDER